MIRFSNNQKDLFDFVNDPIFERVKDPELESIQRVVESSDLMEQFRKILFMDDAVKTDFGRPTRPVDVIIKLLMLRRLYRWGFREAEIMGNDRISVRKFLGLKDEPAPDHSTLSRWNKRIPDSLWKKLNKAIVEYARKKKVTSGRKMRVDTTVIEGNIHYPTDSGLLEDSVKKLGALAKKVKDWGFTGKEMFRDYSRSAKKRLLQIVKYARKRTEEQVELFKVQYKELLGITQRALSHAKQIWKDILDKIEDSEESVVRKVQRIRESYERYIPRIEQVIDQTVRRVFKGETVPAHEKVVSIHEEHFYPIRKGKKAKPVEFGQIYKIQESDGGIIADWENYAFQPSDTHLFIPSIDKHEEIFGKVPHLASADRGFWSEANETCAIEEKRVKRVCIPKRGRKSKDRVIFERQRWFRAGQRFRTGSEATISILKRRFGLNRCMDREQAGMNSWVALGCITRNLWIIAHQVT